MSELLTQNLWKRYGFSGDPFETYPLPISYDRPEAGLSVMNAYVRRGGPLDPGNVLINFMKNPGGGRIAIEGEPGVGKTTFVNFHRFEWEFKADPPLISPVTHISVQKHWKEEDFLLNILSALSARIRLEESINFSKNELLQEISAITGIHRDTDGGFGLSASIAGFGGGVNHSSASSFHIGNVTTVNLREYLKKLVGFVQSELGFEGVIFHLDNLELLGHSSDSLLQQFFEDIRDVLQEPNIYYIFVGYPGMYQSVIAQSQRVKSIFFDKPLFLDPLSLDQVREIIDLRYEVLGMTGKSWIKPVEDEVIDFYYETFDGKIRNIMNGITSLISHIPDSYANTLTVAEVSGLLKEILENELRPTLTKNEKNVLGIAARLKVFNPTALAKETGKSRQMINKHLKKFLELSYVRHGEKVGRSQMYIVESRLLILGQ